ncbi:MAG: RsmD family RNA methyltransferase [Hyphomonadaceae bacterium]|nr:RsmD family RNA methyltransferase [Hyphomonadaceae bacterium]
MPELATLLADDWTDYAVLDSGAGMKLERAGPYTFVRPEPQALWRPRLPEAHWSRADAVFTPSAADDPDAGRWRFNKELPETWPLEWPNDAKPLRFLARATPFRHLGFFPEHSVHWRFAAETLQPGAEVLNLFGYTGLASLACARAGAKVTHVDASKRAIAYARENQAAANLDDASIRWIVDDAHAFVRREARRGRRYDGIILDPPKFGRGPKNEVWKLEEHLAALLEDCAALLTDNAGRRFFIVTVYAVRLSALALSEVARAALQQSGDWQVGEMALPHADDPRLLPTAIFARWRG